MASQRLQLVAATVAALALCCPRWAAADGPTNPTPEERVKKKLMEHYDKTTLPQRESNGTTVVEMAVQAQGAWIEEDKQVIHFNAWILLTWVDPRLTWDHKDYGGLSMVHFGDHEVWQPGIVLYNNADITKVDPYGNTDLIVVSDGTVYWVPPSTLRAECPLDLTYWPYDSQECDLYLGSWTRHGLQVDIHLFNNKTQVIQGWFMKYTHAWQFKGGTLMRIVESYYKHYYVMLRMTLKFSRVSPVYTSTVVLPSVVVSLLTLTQFILPLREPRRLVVGCASLVLTLMHLIFLAVTVPALAYSVPIVVKFFGQTLVVVMVSVSINAALLRLSDTRQPLINTPPPAIIKTILTGPLGTVLFLGQYTDKVSMSGGGGEDGEVLEDSRPPSHTYEWLLVAAAVDRLAAVAFVLIFFFTLIAYVAAV